MQTPTPEVTSDIADDSAAPPAALTPDDVRPGELRARPGVKVVSFD